MTAWVGGCSQDGALPVWYLILTMLGSICFVPAAGRLIFELGGIPERELAKLKEEADRLGKSSFAFAFYMDTQASPCSVPPAIRCFRFSRLQMLCQRQGPVLVGAMGAC